jgi:spore germination protein
MALLSQKNYEISGYEMAIVLIGFIFGIGILTLPRELAETTDTADGWLSILISGAIMMILVTLIIRLSRYFPGKSLFEYMEETVTGKVFAKVFLTVFFVYFLCFLAFQVRLLTIILRMYVLDRTPPEITVILILLTLAFAVTKGVQGIVHLCLLFFPTILLVYAILIILNIGNVELDPLLPVLAKGFTPVLQGIEPTLFSFLGVEILLFWLKYVEPKKVRAFPLNMAIALIILLYLLVVAFTFSVFSVDVTKIMTFPTIELAKEIEVLEGLIERFEPLMITIWILAIFNTMSLLMLLLIQIANKSKRIKNSRVLGLITGLVYILIFLPNSINEVFTIGKWISYLGIILNISALVIGFLFAFIRTKNERKNRVDAK